jgi:hypothetical protein
MTIVLLLSFELLVVINIRQHPRYKEHEHAQMLWLETGGGKKGKCGTNKVKE